MQHRIMNLWLSSTQSHVTDLCAGNELVKDVKFTFDLQLGIKCVPAGAQGLCCGLMCVTVSGSRYLPNPRVLSLLLALSYTNEAECSKRGTIAKLPLWS